MFAPWDLLISVCVLLYTQGPVVGGGGSSTYELLKRDWAQTGVKTEAAVLSGQSTWTEQIFMYSSDSVTTHVECTEYSYKHSQLSISLHGIKLRKSWLNLQYFFYFIFISKFCFSHGERLAIWTRTYLPRQLGAALSFCSSFVGISIKL